MDVLIKKMQIKELDKFILVQVPQELERFLEYFGQSKNSIPSKLDEKMSYLIFVQSENEIKKISKAIGNANELLLWIAYPKKSSKRYKSEINRDHGWLSLGEQGYEGVRQIAINENWSALRFKHVSRIKTITRSFAMSEEGKRRTKK